MGRYRMMKFIIKIKEANEYDVDIDYTMTGKTTSLERETGEHINDVINGIDTKGIMARKIISHYLATEKQEKGKSVATKLLGQFVTARLRNKEEIRQGWIISIKPFIIKGQTGNIYYCTGKPVLISNPPKRIY